MACTACLVCLVSAVSGCRKNAIGRRSASSGHKTKLEQSTFLRYLWLVSKPNLPCVFLNLNLQKKSYQIKVFSLNMTSLWFPRLMNYCIKFVRRFWEACEKPVKILPVCEKFVRSLWGVHEKFF